MTKRFCDNCTADITERGYFVEETRAYGFALPDVEIFHNVIVSKRDLCRACAVARPGVTTNVHPEATDPVATAP